MAYAFRNICHLCYTAAYLLLGRHCQKIYYPHSFYDTCRLIVEHSAKNLQADEFVSYDVCEHQTATVKIL